MEEQEGQSAKELPPRSGEKYRFSWRAKGDEGQIVYGVKLTIATQNML